MNDLYDTLRVALPYVEINGNGYLEYDTDGDGSEESRDQQWDDYCQLNDDLRALGWELKDSSYDHDTIWGQLKPIQP